MNTEATDRHGWTRIRHGDTEDLEDLVVAALSRGRWRRAPSSQAQIDSPLRL